jgi:hypothetical protein
METRSSPFHPSPAVLIIFLALLLSIMVFSSIVPTHAGEKPPPKGHWEHIEWNETLDKMPNVQPPSWEFGRPGATPALYFLDRDTNTYYRVLNLSPTQRGKDKGTRWEKWKWSSIQPIGEQN